MAAIEPATEISCPLTVTSLPALMALLALTAPEPAAVNCTVPEPVTLPAMVKLFPPPEAKAMLPPTSEATPVVPTTPPPVTEMAPVPTLTALLSVICPVAAVTVRPPPVTGPTITLAPPMAVTVNDPPPRTIGVVPTLIEAGVPPVTSVSPRLWPPPVIPVAEDEIPLVAWRSSPVKPVRPVMVPAVMTSVATFPGVGV